MTIDKQKLKALTDRVKTDRRFCADENHHALADGVQALLAEIEENAMHMRAFGEVMRSQAEQIGKLKAENEALRRALGECADELSAEIICKHGGQKIEDMHPVTRRLYERDMAAVTEARAVMAKEAIHD